MKEIMNIHYVYANTLYIKKHAVSIPEFCANDFFAVIFAGFEVRGLLFIAHERYNQYKRKQHRFVGAPRWIFYPTLKI